MANDESKFVLKALRVERSRLESGRCKYSGTRILIDGSSPEKGFNSFISGDIAFDGDRYRADSVGPEWVIDSVAAVPTGQNSKTASLIRGVCRKSFATNGTESAFWLSFQPVLQVANANDAFVPTIVQSICLDPRCPTIFGWGNWNSGILWGQALAELDETPWEITKDDGIWTLVYERKDETGLQTQWKLAIDVENGFVPTKYVVRSSKPNGDFFEEFAVTTDWQEISGLMVPTHLSRKAFPGPLLRHDDQLEIDFQWSDINEQIPDSQFTPASFPVAPGTGIQNVSTSEWVKDFPKQPLAAPVKNSRWSRLILVNAVMLFVLVLASQLKLLNWCRNVICRNFTKLKRKVIVGTGLVVGLAVGFSFWPRETGFSHEGLRVSTFSPVSPPAVDGTEIHLGEVSVGGHVHRDVFITNGASVPLTLKECISELPGAQLYLPSMTIQPGEKVGAFLDCNFDSDLIAGEHAFSIHAVKTDTTNAFTLTAKVKLLPR